MFKMSRRAHICRIFNTDTQTTVQTQKNKINSIKTECKTLPGFLNVRLPGFLNVRLCLDFSKLALKYEFLFKSKSKCSVKC